MRAKDSLQAPLPTLVKPSRAALGGRSLDGAPAIRSQW
jgi:hypothetical protein